MIVTGKCPPKACLHFSILLRAVWRAFYQPRSGRSTFDVGQKKKPMTLAFFCHFCLCAWNIFNWSHYMGVYGLPWTPAIIFETIWTPGPNFGSKGPLAPNLKIAIFSQNLTIWVSMDLPGPQHSFLRQFGPRGQILGPRPLWPQILKFQFSHKTLQYGCL